MTEQLQSDQAAVVADFTRLMVHEPDEETTAWMTAEILQVPPVIGSTILLDQTLRDYRDFLPQIDVVGEVAEMGGSGGEPLLFYGGRYRILDGSAALDAS
jgi:hypothetical protein